MTHTTPDRPARARRYLLTAEELASGRSVRVAQRRQMTLSTVQTWVLSTLAVSTVLHMALAVVWFAHYVDERSSKIGLLVVAAAFGVLAMAIGLGIHRKPILHPLLLTGLLPALAGVWWIFG